MEPETYAKLQRTKRLFSQLCREMEAWNNHNDFFLFCFVLGGWEPFWVGWWPFAQTPDWGCRNQCAAPQGQSTIPTRGWSSSGQLIWMDIWFQWFEYGRKCVLGWGDGLEGQVHWRFWPPMYSLMNVHPWSQPLLSFTFVVIQPLSPKPSTASQHVSRTHPTHLHIHYLQNHPKQFHKPSKNRCIKCPKLRPLVYDPTQCQVDGDWATFAMKQAGHGVGPWVAIEFQSWVICWEDHMVGCH